jgi:hypothetical protein
MSRFKMVLPLLVVLLLLPAAAGCARHDDFNGRVKEITAPYRFSLFGWEVDALGEVVQGLIDGGTPDSDNTEVIFTYFDGTDRVKSLRSAISTADAAEQAPLESELDSLEERNDGLAREVVDQLKVEIRKALSQAGIDNPFGLNTTSQFPPIEVVLESPPHLLVISPRDHIENIKQVHLLPEMTREEMENIEGSVDALGYSSLVVPLGGISTYPSFVTNDGDLRFTIDSIIHEWLHQYLAFTPLGFLAFLNSVGLRQDYDIATINETVVGMVSQEIGATVYEKYVPGGAVDSAPPTEPPSGFGFNRVMRETRTTVDRYLAAGEIDHAEQYMEQQRQYLADNGYHIRKLNQAYFAFYGTYADSPTSVSPIGADLRTLRSQSASVKDFLDTAASLTNLQDLEANIR